MGYYITRMPVWQVQLLQLLHFAFFLCVGRFQRLLDGGKVLQGQRLGADTGVEACGLNGVR